MHRVEELLQLERLREHVLGAPCLAMASVCGPLPLMPMILTVKIQALNLENDPSNKQGVFFVIEMGIYIPHSQATRSGHDIRSAISDSQAYREFLYAPTLSLPVMA